MILFTRDSGRALSFFGISWTFRMVSFLAVILTGSGFFGSSSWNSPAKTLKKQSIELS